MSLDFSSRNITMDFQHGRHGCPKHVRGPECFMCLGFGKNLDSAVKHVGLSEDQRTTTNR